MSPVRATALPRPLTRRPGLYPGRALARLLAAYSLSFFAAAAIAATQSPMRFSHLGADEGLSQGTVSAIIQDAHGFMWIGTQDGLDRYDGYSFTHFSQQPNARGSLPRNFVRALAQDRSGTLWIGTDGGGLATRDPTTGRIAARRKLGDAVLTSPTERVRALHVDRNNRLWVGTANAGLIVIDLVHESVRQLRFDSRDEASLSDDSVLAIAEDQRGGIWIGTAKGLDRVDPDTGRVNRHATRSDPARPAMPEGTSVTTLMQDSEGVLWVGTSAGLLRLDPRSATPVLFRHRDSDPGSLPSDVVQALLEDESHRIWIGTENGLALWSRATNTFTTYSHNGTDPSSLPANEVRVLYQDRGGVIWVGTASDGAARWNPRSWSFGHQQIAALRGDGVANISAFAEDARGTLWVATLGDGLRAFDGITGAMRTYASRPGDAHSLPSDLLNSIYCDSQGIVWLGSRAGLSRLDPKSGRVETFRVTADSRYEDMANNIVQIVGDPSGARIWAAVNGGGLARFDIATQRFTVYHHDPSTADSLPDDHVDSLAFDNSGKLWVGTENGAALFEPRTEKFYAFAHHPDDPTSIIDSPIEAIHVDTHGSVWFGTMGGGLVEVVGDAGDPATIRFQTYGEAEGLANSTVYGIESDSTGRIWVSTNRGIGRFDRTTKRFRVFHHSHGLQGEEFNQGANFRRRDGQLLFGGPNGYNAFYPEKLEFNKHAPQLVLTGYFKLNTPVETPVPLERLTHAELSYRDPVVSFEFAALDYSSPESNRSSYMLEGFDKDWVDAGNKRMVTYTNLAAGNYVFRVRAANGDGTWNANGLAIPITAEPPPWATMPAKITYGVAALLLLFVARHFQMAKIRREAEYARRLETDVYTRTAQLERANQQLKEASLTDPLTGLGNRRYLSEAMSALAKSAGSELRLALMVIDLDHLKPINDAYGHEAGDRVIVQIADILRRCCRTSDYIVRWGGDEFVIAYLDADLDAAARLAEQIRSRIAKQIFRLADGKAARSSCSIGFCCYPFVADSPGLLSWEQTVAIADAGLNQAKTQRNYWVGISSTDSSTSIGSSFIEAIGLDPLQLERSGHIRIRRPSFKPEDTGAHLRIVGRRSSD
jgi:diguanylate cyclase (GGDEF)-like protein